MSWFSDILATADKSILASHGDVWTYTPRAGEAVSITLAERSTDLYGEVSAAQHKLLWGAKADFPTGCPAKRDTVARGSDTYVVHDIQMESGDLPGVILVLEKQS